MCWFLGVKEADYEKKMQHYFSDTSNRHLLKFYLHSLTQNGGRREFLHCFKIFVLNWFENVLITARFPSEIPRKQNNHESLPSCYNSYHL